MNQKPNISFLSLTGLFISIVVMSVVIPAVCLAGNTPGLNESGFISPISGSNIGQILPSPDNYRDLNRSDVLFRREGVQPDGTNQTIKTVSVTAVSNSSGIAGIPNSSPSVSTLQQNNSLSNTNSIRVKLNASEYSIVRDTDGSDTIQMKSFSSMMKPGEPMLPQKIFDILLPPEANTSSLQLTIISADTRELQGTYNISPAGIPMISDDEEKLVNNQSVENWTAKNVVNGKNISIYGKNSSYPENFTELLPYSQMRKWLYTKVSFVPFQYNPVSKKLFLTENVVIEIRYSLSSTSASSSLEADTVMDDDASTMFTNYDQANSWYVLNTNRSTSATTYDYVIITTNLIESNSAKLSSFVTYQQKLGHTVKVITQDEYGSLTGQAPYGTAEKIRQWLKENYVSMGIKYVLLIGNPTPDTGDIPMKMCWPAPTSSYQDAPTDYYYADLTGNWDIDGDTYFGEYSDYTTSGGVDLTADVYVGRIPVYSADYSTLDKILQKIIDYRSSSTSWRKTALLPMSYSDAYTDGATLSEQMRDDYFTSAGYSSYRMYEQGSTCSAANSVYTSDQELIGGTGVRDKWAANDYGIVCWWGHGNSYGAYVGYGSSTCSGSAFMTSSYATSLDDGHPAFVYQNSCTNGQPEYSGNLGYALLKNGAITTVSASRVSWYYIGESYGSYDGSGSNAGIGYDYVKKLVQDLPAGKALFQTKQALTPDGYVLMNIYDFNLYGDPSVYSTLADGVDKVGIFRSSTGQWYITTSSGSTDKNFYYGSSGDTPVVGDWNGDGIASVGIFRSSTGQWYLASPSGSTYKKFYYGSSGDTPVVGDWDGDGSDEVGIFRSSTGQWYLASPSGSTYKKFYYGSSGDTPVVGDWDGDGSDEVGIFRSSTGQWYLASPSGSTYKKFYYGSNGDTPVVGDWDGDGITTVGIFRPSSGQWYLASSTGSTYKKFYYGSSGDTPVVGDWDGDGITTVGIFRPSSGQWYLASLTGSTYKKFYYGSSGDTPVVGKW